MAGVGSVGSVQQAGGIALMGIENKQTAPTSI